jgi:signal transduction histidine kinase/ligand-binding sensor domain-containing protein/CheY-like chemotaxis protein
VLKKYIIFDLKKKWIMRKEKWIALITVIYLILFLPSHSYAQPFIHFPLHRQYRITNLTVDRGMPTGIQSIGQTSDGFLWIASDNGLYRYDGNRCTQYYTDTIGMLHGAYSVSLCVLHDSSLLCGFSNGTILRIKDFRHTLLHDPILPEDTAISCLFQTTDGSIWIGTGGDGLFRYQDGTISRFIPSGGLPSGFITSLTEGPEHQLWVGTQEGLCRFRNDQMKVYSIADGLPNMFILSLSYDRQGRLWIGTHGGLCVMQQNRFKTVTAENLSTDDAIYSIASDAAGDIWFAAYGNGLFRYHDPDGSIERISDDNGLPSRLVNRIFVDRESSIWVSLRANLGLCQLQKPVIQTISVVDGLSGENILPILQASGDEIWIGNAAGGLDCLSSCQILNYGTKAGLNQMPVFSITEDKSHQIWIGSVGSIIVFNSKRFQNKIPERCQPGAEFHALFTASDSSVWIGTNGGIYIIRNGITNSLSVKDGLSDDMVFCFLEDKQGTIWIGTQNGGINKVTNGAITHLTQKDGLTDNTIIFLSEDREGNIWIGTESGGLNLIEKATGKIGAFGEKEGLARCITQIFEDDFGYLWIGANDGILCLPKRHFFEFLSGQREKLLPLVYNTSDREYTMSLNGGIYPAGAKMDDGTIWLPTNHGIAVIDPQQTHGTTTFPAAIIEELQINNVPQPLSHFYSLPPSVMNLSVRFTAPTFIAPERIRFRYRLTGYDEHWNECGNERYAYYTKVPHGLYTFEVQVSNHLGEWNPQVVSVPIRIRPNWFETWWFYLLCFIAISSVVYLIVRFQLQRINEKKLERLVQERTQELTQEISFRKKAEEELLVAKRTVEESSRVKSSLLANMSHEFRTPMNGILGFAEILTSEIVEPGQKMMLSYIYSSARRLMTTLNSIMIYAQLESGVQLHMKKVSIREILERILLIYRPLIREKQLDLNARLEGEMPAETDEHLIYHCLLNVVDNAYKFTAQGSISIEAYTEQGTSPAVVVKVQDTGIGIPPEKQKLIFEAFRQAQEGYDRPYEGSGLGLSISQKTLDLLKGSIVVSSKPVQGSVFTVTIPGLVITEEQLVSEEKKKGESTPVIRDKIRILLVEDNDSNIELTLLYLRKDFIVEVAKDGKTAISLASVSEFDCILMDINLGAGIDGIKVIQEIRKGGPNQTVPIIAVTGYILRNEKEFIIQCGATSYIEKPFTREALRTAISRTLTT